LPDRFNRPQGDGTCRALVVDVETTGLSTEDDDVIQLAMLPFDYEVESMRIMSAQDTQPNADVDIGLMCNKEQASCRSRMWLQMTTVLPS
jgi:DNA polymerase III epsilon subunit-like protein